MADFIPLISSKDTVKVRPAFERVQKARKDLEDAIAAHAALSAEKDAAGKQDKDGFDSRLKDAVAAVDGAEDALEAAEAALAENDTAYYLKPPTGRSRAAAQRDLGHDDVSIPGNSELLDAIALSSALSDEDRAVIERAKAATDAGSPITDDDWPRILVLARDVPEAKRILADRNHFVTILRIHLLRHHLVVRGMHNPLDESVIDAIPPEDQVVLSAKLDELMAPTKAAAKN